MLDPLDAGRSRPVPLGPNTLMVMGLFARADVIAAAAAGAAVAALAMFLATVALLIQGAPEGWPIGPNLAAFSTFWPGYSVTWPGAVIGAAYAALVGAGLGFATAVFWNFAHLIIVGAAVLRGEWLEAE